MANLQCVKSTDPFIQNRQNFADGGHVIPSCPYVRGLIGFNDQLTSPSRAMLNYALGHQQLLGDWLSLTFLQLFEQCPVKLAPCLMIDMLFMIDKVLCGMYEKVHKGRITGHELPGTDLLHVPRNPSSRPLGQMHF